MNCPICGTPLRPADREGIEVDYCPDCHGVWIGREQLDQILAQPSPFEADWTIDPSNDKESSGNEFRRPKRNGQPGFWTNLFAV
jgi:Zn-finger nucleic acid-binding protein